MQLTVRSIVEQGQGMTPDAINEITAALLPKRSDLRRGVLLCAVGVAILICALVWAPDGATTGLMGVSAFPFLLGFAYLGLAWMENREART